MEAAMAKRVGCVTCVELLFGLYVDNDSTKEVLNSVHTASSNWSRSVQSEDKGPKVSTHTSCIFVS